jgi:hypothetical protein
MSIDEMIKVVFGQRYIKMYLLREGIVVGTYIRNISSTGWLLDKKLKKAWMIPPEGQMIQIKKSLVFFGSLEASHSYTFEEIKKNSNLKPLSWKNAGFPFLKPVFTPNNWTIEKTKFIFGKDKEGKRKQEYDFVDKEYKTYKPILPSLDLGMLYHYLTGHTIYLISKPPSEPKKDINWTFIVIGIMAVVALYYMFHK